MRVAQEPAIDVSVITAKSKVIPVPPVKTVSRSEPPVKIIYCEITAYSPTVAECDASPLATASGKRVYVGGIAADLSILPFGSRVLIPDYNGGKPCTVIDTGRAIRGNKLDVFFWNPQDSVNWGRRRNVRVTVLYIPRR
jgi:3D (Asp-Asp-Asp) domain-containing protein